MIQEPIGYLPPTLSHVDATSWLHLERLSAASGVTRSLIGSTLSQAHGPWLLHLEPGERIATLEIMASVYACLGYNRKEAYILREVLGCIMDLLVCGREESDTDNSNPSTNSAEPGNRRIPLAGERGSMTMRQSESSTGNESVLRLLRYICAVFGIDFQAVGLVSVEEDVDKDGERSRSSFQEELRDYAMNTLQDTYGWPELQIGVIREAIAVAEALPGV
jgi:trafficking protein particle complex subunit 9